MWGYINRYIFRNFAPRKLDRLALVFEAQLFLID